MAKQVVDKPTLKMPAAHASRPTIFTVAQAVDISITAVSRILNHPGKHGYSQDVEKRVLNACRRLRYRPNQIARSLAKGVNPAVSLLCDSLTDFNVLKAVNHAVELGATKGLQMVVTTKPTEVPWQNLLNEGRVSWIIAIGDYMITRSKELLAPHLMERIISVCSGPISDPLPVACNINWDSSRHGTLAADHLFDLGHREIAILAGPYPEPSDEVSRVYGAFLQAQKLGMTVRWIDNPMEKNPQPIPESGQTMMKRVLEDYPKVTAVLCRQDYHAIGVYRQLYLSRRRIPDDMAVVGNFNLQDFFSFDPPLTSVDSPLVEGIERAINFIVTEDQSSQDRQLDLTDSIRLIPRESTERNRRAGLGP